MALREEKMRKATRNFFNNNPLDPFYRIVVDNELALWE
jgi:hypothetical protein